MEDRSNTGLKKYKTVPDQTLSNAQNYEIVKVNSTPTGGQAAPTIGEAEADTGREAEADTGREAEADTGREPLATVEGGDVPQKGKSIRSSLPLPTSWFQMTGGASRESREQRLHFMQIMMLPNGMKYIIERLRQVL
ncbi:hypothetical protein NDU88_001553 [Pleurodeles waltl]|uniref:Uncharacterized protein n=1 Tax=Pleurodeles waltl TaxID=8319 RepID=A0AAV7KPW0_PLEWA|nr:hypothetical protein NDU88_001553 [Pleurodeles waltl]